MKRIILFSLVVIAAAFFAGCQKKTTPDGYILSSDKSTVTVGESVTFKMTSPTGKDISDNSQVCGNGQCYAGMTVPLYDAGSYTFEGHYTDDTGEMHISSNTVTITVTE